MTIIDTLTEEVEETRGVMQSATALIEGFQEELRLGIEAARAGDFERLTTLESDLQSGKEGLAAAVVAHSGGGTGGGGAEVAVSGASWDENTRVLRKSKGFEGYTHGSGQSFTPSAGTGVNLGVSVPVEGKVDDNAIVLESTIGAAADGRTDIGGVLHSGAAPVPEATSRATMRGRPAR